MALNSSSTWPKPRQPGEHSVDNRPGSAASVASSTSSFRIPGLRPNASKQVGDSPRASPSPSPAPSFVRIFAPREDDHDTSWQHGQESRVDWLANHGPSPRELIDSSQGVTDFRQVPPPPFQRHSDKQLWPPQPTMPAFGPSASYQENGSARPFTASSYHRSKLVTGDGLVGSYVCALIENRGTGREVGIASIEKETGKYEPSTLALPFYSFCRPAEGFADPGLRLCPLPLRDRSLRRNAAGRHSNLRPHHSPHLHASAEHLAGP